MQCLSPAPVYIVDDDAAARNSLRFMLESEGYAVRAFGDGPSLLSALSDHDPGPLIIDVRMPGLDGIALSCRVREMHRDASILLITGHPDPAIRRRADDAGIPLIEKPLSQDALLSALGGAEGRCCRPGHDRPSFALDQLGPQNGVGQCRQVI